MPEDGTRPTADRPGLGRRFLFRLAVHYEDVFSLFFDFVEALLLFIAFLIIDSIVALQTGFLITANVGNLAFAAVIVILFQRLLGLTTINEVDYAVYLAHRASDQSEEESTAWAGERPPTVEFHLHMKA